MELEKFDADEPGATVRIAGSNARKREIRGRVTCDTQVLLPPATLPTPLDILYVGTLPPHPGGTAISCSQILVGLARLGHTVRSIAPMTPETLECGDSSESSPPRLGVRPYIVPHFQTRSLTAPVSYREFEGRQLGRVFAELVAEKRPDVVIAGRESFAWHVPKLAAAVELACVVRASGGPWIGLLHGRYGRALSREMLTELRRAALIVTPARHMARQLQALEVGTVRVVPEPVDMERFRPGPRDRGLARTLGIDDGDLVVLHASKLRSIKRPLDIVYSAERVLARQPRITYLVVGDGTSREEMEAACASAGVRHRFRFAGWVDYERMPEYLNLADIVLMPSETEAQSRVCLEAHSSGRALLASDIPGAREIVADGQTGILFQRGNIEDLTAKTLFLAERTDVRRRIGEQARQRMRHHSLPAVVRAYDAILAELARTDAHSWS